MKTLALLFFAVFWPLCAWSSPRPLVDVEVSSRWVSFENRDGADGVVRFSTCRNSFVNDSRLIQSHQNLQKCVEFARMETKVNGTVGWVKQTFSTKEFLRQSVMHDIPLDDAVLMISLWRGRPGNGNDVYVEHQFVNFWNIAFGTKAKTPVILGGSAGLKATLELTSAASAVDPKFADLNPPAQSYANASTVKDAFTGIFDYYSGRKGYARAVTEAERRDPSGQYSAEIRDAQLVLAIVPLLSRANDDEP